MVDRRALAGGPALTGHAHRENFQIIREYKYVNKMTGQKIYKKLFDTVEEAGKLIAKFGNISIPATMKKTPNGKYIVTFRI
jgi:hypothetical protein